VALSLHVKWPGRVDDHSLASSAKIKECVELYIHSPNSYAQGQLYIFTLYYITDPFKLTHSQISTLQLRTQIYKKQFIVKGQARYNA